MLRDKLTSAGSELVDARTRIAELESTQALDRAALQVSAHSLANAGSVNRFVGYVILLTIAQASNCPNYRSR